MATQYKVTKDSSMTGNNNPEAIEEAVNELAAQGWRLAHVAAFAAEHQANVYCFFERETP